MEEEALKTEELTAILREVRERVRARYPESPAAPPDLPLADLMPLVRARDAAEAKAASIGMVNPRRGGPVNALVQGIKRLVARALDWHVREQVAFNRNTMACVEAILEALNEHNRALVKLGAPSQELRDEAREMKDVHSHWMEWRAEWERKLARNELHFLRSAADLQGAFEHRASMMEANFRELARTQHGNFQNSLDRHTLDVQQRLWDDLARIRLEFERLIHEELRIVRQRAAASIAAVPAPAPPATAPAAPQPRAPEFDYGRFAERFRGSETYVREKQRFYLPFFQRRREVLDLGCGRGEFLELMRDAGVNAGGVDGSAESVALCHAKGLRAEQADLFDYLAGLADASLDGIFCAQVVEHIPPDRIPELIRLASAKMQRGGLLAIETPNPECLAIFAVHFYLDPTHQRPVPHPLLAFYLEEHGLGAIEVHKLSPALESMPALASLPEDFRNAFFGGLDYAIVGRKL